MPAKITMRTLIADAKAFLGGRCVRCGTYDNLEFDHIDRRTKVAEVIALARGTTQAAFWAEVHKCQLLCREHHLEKTRIENIGVARPRKVKQRGGRWSVTSIALIDPEAGVTAIRGGGVLLGAGVQAQCTDGVAVATLSISVDPSGGICCDSIEVARSAATGGVNSTDLHMIPVRRLIREAFASLDEADWRPQRATDAPATMAAVVACWQALQGTSDGHRATAVTAQQLGYSRGHVSRVLSQARREGLILH